ncbi:unnamed protein product [Polarella glacialis]|uniref:Calmodulin n=1 Tax=Polarella glacialis TaxID=89957 RepID=A0A813IF04_POLGL|nr:unnamed protein product [Polarella glacialis]
MFSPTCIQGSGSTGPDFKGQGSAHVRSVLELRRRPSVSPVDFAAGAAGLGDNNNSNDNNSNSNNNSNNNNPRAVAASFSAPALLSLRPTSAPSCAGRPKSPWRGKQLPRSAPNRAKPLAEGDGLLQRVHDAKHGCSRPCSAQTSPNRRRKARDVRPRLDLLCSGTMRDLRMNIRNVRAAFEIEGKIPDEPVMQTGQNSSELPEQVEVRRGHSNQQALAAAVGKELQLLQNFEKQSFDAPLLAVELHDKKGWVHDVHSHGSRASSANGSRRSSFAGQQLSVDQLDDLLDDVEPKAKEGSKESRWEAAFQRLQVSGEIHKESLPAAIELAGFAMPRKAWVDEILSELTSFSTLDLDEFIKLLNDYETKQFGECSRIFHRFDEDKSGTIEAHELAAVLEHCGITALDQVIAEIVVEAGPANAASLTEEEFKRVLNIIYTYEGYSKREVEKLKMVFQKFDFSGDGALDIVELHAALCWLGYALSEAAVKQIADKVDIGGKGKLREHEFLVCMRKVREKEIQSVKKAIKKLNGSEVGQLNMSQHLEGVLRILGYIPDAQAIQDAAEDSGLVPPPSLFNVDGSRRPSAAGSRRPSAAGSRRPSPPGERRGSFSGGGARRHSIGGSAGSMFARRNSFSTVAAQAMGGSRLTAPNPLLGGMTHSELIKQLVKKKISLSDLFRFLEVYRRREGMDRELSRELEEAFVRYDKEGAGEISVVEVGKVLRWMGYPCHFDLQAKLVAEVDVDKSGNLDLVELRKLMRKFRERELIRWSAAFMRYDEHKEGYLDMFQTIQALRSLGLQSTEDKIAVLTQKSRNRRSFVVRKASQAPPADWLAQLKKKSLVGGLGSNFGRQSSGQSHALIATGSDSKGDASTRPKTLQRGQSFNSKGESERTIGDSEAIDEDSDEAGSDFGGSDSDSDSDSDSRSSGGSGNDSKKDGSNHSKQSHFRRVSGCSSGFTSDEDEEAPPERNDAISVYDFQGIVAHLTKKARAGFRNNAGYSAEEVMAFRPSFKKYDVDGSGDICNAELVKLVADLYPRLMTDPKNRPALQKLLKEADENADGALDFQDFLRFMRHFDDEQLQNRIAKEQRAKDKTGFSTAEVEDFREFFMGKEQHGGIFRSEIPLADFVAMINRIARLSRAQVLEVTEIFNELACADDAGGEGAITTAIQAQQGGSNNNNNSTADFAEFLMLMERVLRDDVAGIKAASQRIAEKVEKEQKQRRKNP